MDNNKLLNKIGNLIEEKLEKKLEEKLTPIKKQLDTVELKVGAVNNKIDKVHQKLQQSIEQSQEDTIDAVSELINTGYNLHEKRIKKIEGSLGITAPHQ